MNFIRGFDCFSPSGSKLLSLFIGILIAGSLDSYCYAQSTKWVGTWSTAPQLVETHNNPPSPGLTNNTLRQIVRVSIGGDTLRMRFSNEFSTSAVHLNEVHFAISTGSDTVDLGTDTAVLFDGAAGITMEPGSAAMSDPFPFALLPGTNVAITIYFGSTSPDVTGHPGSRTTSYLLSGNTASRADFSGSVRTDHWYIINTIDVKAPDSAAAVVVVGNSITDGRGSGTNKQNRWPDEMARRFQEDPNTRQVAVLNQGIGGNCVLGSCLGPSALSRFERDVINQNGVRWLIILEGINDIGWGSPGVGERLIDAYEQMIHTAHTNGIFVYGATLLPMHGSSYYTADHEAERQTVNAWIRNSGRFDAVIDMDKALRNPADTLSLLPAADTGDHLHPNETGHRMMAEAVDLGLFTGRDSLVYQDETQSIYFEPECSTVGSRWNILADSQASNGEYVSVQPGIQSLDAAPADSAGRIYIHFSLGTAATYSVLARLNCPTYDDDSFWVSMDAGPFELNNGLVTSGWEWRKLGDYALTVGAHTLTIGYREDGARLDKICISNSAVVPLGMGEEAEIICTSMEIGRSTEAPGAYELNQNYPNPFNPLSTIRYDLPKAGNVSLLVYDMLGREVMSLVEDYVEPGYHEIKWNGQDFASGVYIARLVTPEYSKSIKMLLLK